MLQNHRLLDLDFSYSRGPGGFAFRDCWLYEMDLVRYNLADTYAPSSKKLSNPAIFNIVLRKVHSGQRWRVRKSVLEPPEGQKDSPWDV